MRKGYSSDITWLIAGVFIFVLVGIFILTVLTTNADIKVDFPRTSANIGAYSLLQEVLSEDCLGTGTVGILDKTKLDSRPVCITDPSFSSYVKVVDGSGNTWEYGEYFDKSSFQSTMPVLIDDKGVTGKGTLTFSFSYVTDDLLLLLRACSDEAFYVGKCERSIKIDSDITVKYQNTEVCANSKCLPTAGKFRGAVEYDYGPRGQLTRHGTPITITTITRIGTGELEVSHRSVEVRE